MINRAITAQLSENKRTLEQKERDMERDRIEQNQTQLESFLGRDDYSASGASEW